MQAFVRRAGYFVLDRLTGGLVMNHLRDLEQWATGHDNYRNEVGRRRLQSLLHHAVDTVPYYTDLKNGELELLRFPVVRKSDISKDYARFLSMSHERGNLIPVTTSGSYGTPFTFLLTRQKMARRTAEVIWFSRWVGYRIGDRHAYVRVTKKKSPRTLWLQNEVLMDPTSLGESWLEAQRQELLKRSIRFLIGYPSAISTLAAYCEQKGNSSSDFGVEGIVTSGEPLRLESRKLVKRVFGAPVLSRYSSEETGVLAHECSQCEIHHLNTASYFFEVLKLQEDSPAEPGELGRIVVTDLFSHAMPIIRYEIGDLGVLGAEPCSCGSQLPVLVELHGRTVEQILDVNQQRVSPFAINGAFRDLLRVQQFQFIQVGKGQYQVLLVALPNFQEEHVIRTRLNEILGSDAKIDILLVDEIPALPSGKRPYILNRMSD